MTPSETPYVYRGISAITAALAKSGIAKDRSNAQQGFKFRGIDDVYNALAPLLAEHALCILPRVTNREVTERQTKSGGVLFSVAVAVEFDIVAAQDGSKHTVALYGEAMDSGDKATNKAMSAAYKYMALEVFCIPTEGDNDADATTHEPIVAAKKDSRPLAAKKDELMISGKPVSKCTSKTLIEAKEFYKDRPDAAKLLEQIDLELDKRRDTAVSSLSA